MSGDSASGAGRPPRQFHVLSFEGPDPYSRAGGVATRVTGLAEALACAGFETHLWFIGDPDLPGHEARGLLHLHRWCQWISAYHRGGVYEGEEGKQKDFASSLPPFLVREHLIPHLARTGGAAVVLAEEWQTVDAVVHLDWLLRNAGLRPRVAIHWNANNVFGFHRIDWERLKAAATITTVSRYMRQEMWPLGVDPLVIPNGLSSEMLRPPDAKEVAAFRRVVRDRLALTKIARWDPDKRWILAVDIVAELKRQGWRPLLIARGGVEGHGVEVLARAAAHGLTVAERAPDPSHTFYVLESLRGLEAADLVIFRTPLSGETCRVLYRGSAAVLANSGREPFGLVGLEAMAAGGLACLGGTGEDYAIPGWNCLVLQTDDPHEFLNLFLRVLANVEEERALRRRGTATARRYAWSEIVRRNLLPRVPLADGETVRHNNLDATRRRRAGAPPQHHNSSTGQAMGD